MLQITFFFFFFEKYGAFADAGLSSSKSPFSPTLHQLVDLLATVIAVSFTHVFVPWPCTCTLCKHKQTLIFEISFFTCLSLYQSVYQLNASPPFKQTWDDAKNVIFVGDFLLTLSNKKALPMNWCHPVQGWTSLMLAERGASVHAIEVQKDMRSSEILLLLSLSLCLSCFPLFCIQPDSVPPACMQTFFLFTLILKKNHCAVPNFAGMTKTNTVLKIF